MKKGMLLISLLCLQAYLFAQQDAWIYLLDKQDVANAIANPTTILTQKAIDRKNAHGVTIDARDVPVNEDYITQLKNATGITVMAKSKWFNAVHVRGSQVDIDALSSLLFVTDIVFADKSLNTAKTSKSKEISKLETAKATFNYGNALNQIQMIKGDKLHLSDYTGSGMTVAVLDAGFPNVNTMSSFQYLRNAGGILDDYDFVNRDDDVYTAATSNHGTLVLSDMAGYVDGQFVGTAPDAKYYLFVTEDALNENPVEESYWVEAAERADSLGVDVINTSLGYTTFDNPNYDYSQSDMDGNTTFISRGANIAFEKGMLMVNSAGNSGSDAWGIVGAPADAPGVLSVGAVNASGTRASFSSIGSNAQPTIKPDVMAQGEASYVIFQNGGIGTANGTSFSSPILAGGIVCLWQALPNKTNAEIMQLVRESASQYNSPDYYYGYGIPNLELALNNALSVKKIDSKELKIFPNPTTDFVYINFPEEISNYNLNLFDILGREIAKGTVLKEINTLDMSSLSNGMYLLKLAYNQSSKTFQIIKK